MLHQGGQNAVSVQVMFWWRGGAICDLMSVLQVDGFLTLLFGLSSIYTLTVISITRYVKGCQPGRGIS